MLHFSKIYNEIISNVQISCRLYTIFIIIIAHVDSVAIIIIIICRDKCFSDNLTGVVRKIEGEIKCRFWNFCLIRREGVSWSFES